MTPHLNTNNSKGKKTDSVCLVRITHARRSVVLVDSMNHHFDKIAQSDRQTARNPRRSGMPYDNRMCDNLPQSSHVQHQVVVHTFALSPSQKNEINYTQIKSISGKKFPASYATSWVLKLCGLHNVPE